MRIGLIGINHKLADVKLREKLAKACQKLCSHFKFSFENSHSVLLSTCNRTEIYFSSDDLPTLHSHLLTLLRQDMEEEFDQKLYSFFGIDCFFHLTKVASGLDSAILGETEILGQVKLSYENALTEEVLSKDLHFLFQKSLAIAKKVRTDFQLRRGMPNLHHYILKSAKRLFENYEQKRVLFVGASEINHKVLEFLKNKKLMDITICNRTDSKAQTIASKQEIQFILWKQLDTWHQYDWIILGTKSQEHLIQYSDIQFHSFKQQKLIVDLCVPRNADPKIGNHASMTLLNIDEITHELKSQRTDLIDIVAQAENHINQSIQIHSRIYTEKEKNRKILFQVPA